MASATRRCAGGVAASPRSGAAAGGGRRGTGAARAVAASACSFANRLANPSLRALGRRDRRPVAAFRTHGGAGESRPETGGEDAPSRVDFSPGPSSRSSQLWSVTQPPSARFAPALFSGVGRPCGWWCACFVGERVESSRQRKERKERSERQSRVSRVRERKRKIDRPRAPFERSRRPVFGRSNVRTFWRAKDRHMPPWHTESRRGRRVVSVRLTRQEAEATAWGGRGGEVRAHDGDVPRVRPPRSPRVSPDRRRRGLREERGGEVSKRTDAGVGFRG